MNTLAEQTVLGYISEKLDDIQQVDRRKRDAILRAEQQKLEIQDRIDDAIVVAMDTGGVASYKIAEVMGYKRGSAGTIVRKARERVENRRVEVR